MNHSWRCFVILGFASTMCAQTAAVRRAAAATKPPEVFQKYCFECHGSSKPKAGLSLERLVAQPSIGPHADAWDKVAGMLETAEMPPSDAEELPTDAERRAAAAWVRSALKTYDTEHGGEPGRVTVRRLTSGEYAYAIRDLTGIDISVGIDASSDSVGGEGFTNFGDVQFMQDASIERYLEAAKAVADHTVIGSGPLQFAPDIGRAGLELSAINRINDLHYSKGFRLVSGEGGFPFGLEKYTKAFYVAWYYKHRKALGDPNALLRELAAKEDIPAKFAENIWSVLNRPNLGYPVRETADRWKALPAPTADVKASLAQARASCDEIHQALIAWPVWFFNRGELAKDGKGDESPLIFDDKSLAAEVTHGFVFALRGGRGGRGDGAGGGGAVGPSAVSPPAKVQLDFSDINPSGGVKPVVIWRNARVVKRAVQPGARGATQQSDDTGAPPRVSMGPILSTQALRSLISPEAVKALAFGQSPDGSAMGPDDFATTATVSLELALPAGTGAATLEVEAELGADRNGVVRLALTNGPNGSQARSTPPHPTLLGDRGSAGYKTFRAGIAEYLATMPPSSHGEANPADKDPVPWPFDSTYNTPEHDAFVLKVKYQRTDQFFADFMVDDSDRERLNHAWNDLFDAFPYHDGYLSVLADHYNVKLNSSHIQDLDQAQLAALPAEMLPQVEALRAGYQQVRKAQLLAEPGQIEDALAFASRAWRRPLTSEEKTKLKAFYQKSRQINGLDHDGAIRALLVRALVSPAFLYRLETVASRTERPLNDWEMASRLSFFLWSSIPDGELRRAAAAGELSKPVTLAKQVKRMTADPKARRLSTEFFGQWLGFYHFDEYRGVETARFPEFTDEVRSAMYDEAVSTFEYIVRNERPVIEIVQADYTFLNQPLAKFYGIQKEVKSKDAMELVTGANAFDRGGALRLGSVLTVTSAPLRTSPVKRGDWVLRRILGTPTPPPPADAGTIPRDDKAFGGQTLREQLAAHKRNATCAACHLKIDPLGFALEGFDAVGRTRDKSGDGKPLDVTGEFADKSTISGTAGLLKYLSTRDKQIVKMLSRKMLGYALGRTVQASDRSLLEDMTAAGGNATFSDLAVKVVTSRQFRNHAAGDDEGVTPAATVSLYSISNRLPSP